MSHFNHILKGIVSQRTSAIDADVATYLASLTTPLSAAQINVLDVNIKGLKSDLGITTLFQAFDVILHLGSETAEGGLKNLVRRANDPTGVNNPTHTPYIGYNGDGLTKYINMNYRPSINGTNFTLNNASFGFYKHETEAGIFYDMGTRDGANVNGTWIAPKFDATQFRVHINDNRSAATSDQASPTDANPDSIALFTANRTASDRHRFYRNATSLREVLNNSSALAVTEMFVCGMNNAGTLLTTAPSTKPLGLAFAGRGFSEAEMVHVSYWFNKLVAETKALI